jgi:hypothetical protein
MGMSASILNGRKFYQTSGNVNWVRFIPWAALVFVTGAVISLLMLFLSVIGFYLVLIVPLAGSAGIAGMVLLAVSKGQCRSRFIGGLLGAVAGIFVYLGYYYASMVHDIGLENASRIELLPRYIYLRIQTDQVHDVGSPTERPDQGAHSNRKYFNALFFVVEFGFNLFLPYGAGVRWAGKAYCEKCQLWMKRETSTFQPELGPGFVEALRLGSVQSLAALFTSPPKPSVPNTAVALDYCPNLKDGWTTLCPVFMSVKQVVMSSRGATLDAFDNAKGKMLVRRTLINPDEMPALLSRFRSLETATGTTAAQVLKELKVEVADPPAQATVEVRPVDPQFAGKVLTKKNALIGTGIALLGLVAVFGSIGIGALGGFLAFPDHPPVDGVSPVMKVMGISLIVLAGLIFVANAVMMFTSPSYFATRFLRRVTLREFGRRPAHLVNPADSSAVYVQVIPRATWGKMKLIDASDIGFLRVDTQKGDVYFEGDKEVYRIPGAAITSCEIESFVIGQGSHGATTVFRVVVQANHSSGFWEAPFAQTGSSGKFRRKARLKWAQDLQRQIYSVKPAARAVTGAV